MRSANPRGQLEDVDPSCFEQEYDHQEEDRVAQRAEKGCPHIAAEIASDCFLTESCSGGVDESVAEVVQDASGFLPQTGQARGRVVQVST